MDALISFSDAYNLVINNSAIHHTLALPLRQAEGHVLAADVYAPFDFPSFRQSAVDGYAFSFNAFKPGTALKVLPAVIAAGNSHLEKIDEGYAMRIFTGAAVPDGTDTVVMQEQTKTDGDELFLLNNEISQGLNVRPRASQTRQGDRVLAKGDVLTPAGLALLAGFGLQEIPVYRKPIVSLLISGNELLQAGDSYEPGKIYESNSYALQAALHDIQIEVNTTEYVSDDLEKMKQAVDRLLNACDILLACGGISVGDFDFTSEALKQNSVEKIFHGVKQKPGKPLWFGKRQDKIVFGLPGNPGSVLSCFYFYVLPAVRNFCNHPQSDLEKRKALVINGFAKKQGLTHFLKVKSENNTAEILEHQESYKMNGFARANALLIMTENETQINAGDLKYIHLLP